MMKRMARLPTVFWLTTVFALGLIFAVCDTPSAYAAPKDPCSLFGKVRVVEHGGDVRVKVVSHFPDLKVKVVQWNANKPGEWQMVEHFEDFTIQFVEHFPDVKIKYVEHFPGCK